MNKEKRIPPHQIIGSNFGRLEVIDETGEKNHKGEYTYICVCICGELRINAGSRLRNKNGPKSCGCITREILLERNRGALRFNKSPKWKGYEEIPGRYLTILKIGAKARNLEVKIDLKDIWEIFVAQGKRCALTGREISFYNTNRKNSFTQAQYNKEEMKTASVDRIDSSKGYTKDNIQIVHKDINKIKMEFSQSKFINICKEVYLYNLY